MRHGKFEQFGDNTMTLQEKIRQRRVEQGMSLTETAKRLGISRETLYRYETGKIAKIPMQYLTTLAHILKTDVSYFINNSTHVLE